MIKEYKGYNGKLEITNTGIIIKHGIKGFFLGGGKIRGDKSIPFKSIVAVQFKKAGLTSGYLQVTLIGGSDAKGGTFQASRDENTISFNSHRKNKLFLEAKEIIEKNINGSLDRGNLELDSLEKLAELKNKNIISEEEFKIKKKQILGI